METSEYGGEDLPFGMTCTASVGQLPNGPEAVVVWKCERVPTANISSLEFEELKNLHITIIEDGVITNKMLKQLVLEGTDEVVEITKQMCLDTLGESHIFGINMIDGTLDGKPIQLDGTIFRDMESATYYRDALFEEGWEVMTPPNVEAVYDDNGEARKLNRSQRRRLAKRLKRYRNEEMRGLGH